MKRLFLFVIAKLVFTGSALANTVLTIAHRPVPAPAYIDEGERAA